MVPRLRGEECVFPVRGMFSSIPSCNAAYDLHLVGDDLFLEGDN